MFDTAQIDDQLASILISIGRSLKNSMTDAWTLKENAMKNRLPTLASIETRIRSFISWRNPAFAIPEAREPASGHDEKPQRLEFSAMVKKTSLEIIPLPKPARCCRPRFIDQRSNTIVEYTRSNLG